MEDSGVKDLSGQPRSKREILDALIAVEWAIVKDILSVPPLLGVSLPTIRDALNELLDRRNRE